MDRRTLIKAGLAFGGTRILFKDSLLLADDTPMPKGKRFVIYLHFGSACGANSGLVQPLKAGQWPIGHFQAGKVAGSNNPLINQHTQAGRMVFHDYNKFMADISDDMCLVSGTPQNLDHAVGSTIQKCGSTSFAITPEWGMALTQNMKTAATPNPMMISNSRKTFSVPDVTVIRANSFDEFKRITRDVEGLPRVAQDPLLLALKRRFEQLNLKTTLTDKSLVDAANYQLTTLAAGLTELNDAQGDFEELTRALAKDSVTKLVSVCAEAQEIEKEAQDSFRNQLILAGILAKTGIACGMNIDLMSEDTHATGSDYTTPRMAAGRWALINLFWKWVRSVNLQDEVMIIVNQEFGRSPYNKLGTDVQITTREGSKKIFSPGRDHGLHMGTMFINGKVPRNGRVGIVSDNLSPLAGKDCNGTPDKEAGAYTIERIMGSMFMRVYPDLFPTEEAVKVHWPNFKVIPPILA